MCSAVLVVLGAAYTVKYNQVVAKFAAKLEKDAQEAAASASASASVSASAPSGASGEEEAERLKAEGEFMFAPARTAWHVEVQGGVIRVCVCVCEAAEAGCNCVWCWNAERGLRSCHLCSLLVMYLRRVCLCACVCCILCVCQGMTAFGRVHSRRRWSCTGVPSTPHPRAVKPTCCTPTEPRRTPAWASTTRPWQMACE